MSKIKALVSLILVLAVGLATTGYVSATPSTNIDHKNSEAFDDWGICRTRAFGEDGFYQISKTTFRPVITFESLGEGTDSAYSLGEQFAHQYSDMYQRADAIFRFVRDRVIYTPDIDQLWYGAKYEEFAQNADELAVIIEHNGVGYGDCEDSAVLLAVMYKGAGYRSAIVVGPGHTAALVYLPDYHKASAIFELDDELGWIWAEATCKNNDLGGVPKELTKAELIAYEIGEETIDPLKLPRAPSTVVVPTGGGALSPFPFMGIFGLLWLLSLFRRRHAR